MTRDQTSTGSESDIGPLLADSDDACACTRLASNEQITSIVAPSDPFQRLSDTDFGRSDTSDDYGMDDGSEYSFADLSTMSNIGSEPADNESSIVLILEDPEYRGPESPTGVQEYYVNTSHSFLCFDDGDLADTEDTSLSSINTGYDTSTDSLPRAKNLGRREQMLFEAIARMFVPTSYGQSIRKEVATLLMRAPPVPPSTPAIYEGDGAA